MYLSQLLSTVQPPIIPTVNQWVRDNPGTLSLGQGMVSYPPPDSALSAIQQFGRQAEQHYYGQALGLPALLAAIESKLRQDNNIDCQQGYRVMVTAGSNMAFLNLVLAISDPQDEIILPVPYYFNQEMAIRMLGRVPVFVATDADYQLQLDALQSAITDKTRAIVTISPNNPTGAVYPEQDLRAVNTLCRQHGLYHISDEAYEYFTYDGSQHFSPASIADAENHTISLYSLSKAYGFAGWRVGYMVFPKALLPGLLKIQDTNLICPPTINQQAALAALTVGADYCKTQLTQLFVVRQKIVVQLQTIADICDLPLTMGGFYFLLRLKTQANDLDLVKMLIEDYKVAAIPGRAFGLESGCYLRISYGMLKPDQADVAIQRLIEGIKASSKK